MGSFGKNGLRISARARQASWARPSTLTVPLLEKKGSLYR